MIEYDTLKFTKVEVSNDLLQDFEEEGFTYLHCTYSIRKKNGVNNWWVNINTDSAYLIGSNSSKKLMLINAIGIAISPQKHYFKNVNEKLKFTLIFPAVPKSWKTFDFIEAVNPSSAKASNPNFTEVSFGGFDIRNIPRNSTGVYKVVIQ